MFVNINDIIITDRIRQDNGDLTKLVNSIELIGLINPIVISEKYELLSGYRRLQACKSLGWEKIDAKMVSVGSRLQKIDWEYHENIGRKDLSLDEEEAYLAIRQALLHP
ncbi:MAG: chromosome partitioning protein ParB, partial [Calditrichaeota bacterium]